MLVLSISRELQLPELRCVVNSLILQDIPYSMQSLESNREIVLSVNSRPPLLLVYHEIIVFVYEQAEAMELPPHGHILSDAQSITCVHGMDKFLVGQ